jgi:hypothetical protein
LPCSSSNITWPYVGGLRKYHHIFCDINVKDHISDSTIRLLRTPMESMIDIYREWNFYQGLSEIHY